MNTQDKSPEEYLDRLKQLVEEGEGVRIEILVTKQGLSVHSEKPPESIDGFVKSLAKSVIQLNRDAIPELFKFAFTEISDRSPCECEKCKAKDSERVSKNLH